MNDGNPAIPTEALEDIAYLSRSPNRVKLLAVLVDGSATRQALAERTGTSRTTLDRIINELEDRGWAERAVDGTYTATAQGRQFHRQFQTCLDSVVAIRRLGDTVDWLPTTELTVGLEHFSDAEVQRPAQDDPVETFDHMVDLINDASEHRAFTHLVPPEPLSEAIREGVETGRLTPEGVLTTDSIEFIKETPTRRDRWAVILETGTDLYRYDGTIPCNLWLFDETVLIKKSGPDSFAEAYGVPIVSQNEAVRTWATQLIDTYRAEATRLDPGFFTDHLSAPE